MLAICDMLCQNDLFSRKKVEIEECTLREHFSHSFLIAGIYHPKAGQFIRHVQNRQESDKKKLSKQTNGQIKPTVTNLVKENLLLLPGCPCGGGTSSRIK